MLLLDTDHLSILEDESSAEHHRLSDRLETAGQDDIATTIVNFQERIQGRLAYLNKLLPAEEIILAYARLERLLADFAAMRVLSFSEFAQAQFERLRREKVRLGTMDLRIAGIALAHNARLLSRNLRDFRKVPGLLVEDWTTP